MSLPTPLVKEDCVRVFFGSRDHLNRSFIGWLEFDPRDRDLTNVVRSCEPALSLGELGCFDDNGVMPCSLVAVGNSLYLYYVGWNPRSTTRFSFFSGLAISTDGGSTFSRYSRAPLLERTANEPFVNASPMVLRDDGIYRMYYVSGEGWVNPDLPRYNIKYAESFDGISWDRNGYVAIDFSYPGEHALARPVVVKESGVYKMWFSAKGSDYFKDKNYGFGYAESVDGKNFVRADEYANFSVSERGWDSEMVCYGYPFEFKSKRYMIYNGNEYGRDGFGLAIAD